jgi:phage host-nuclease inhibitor protein Gam
MIIDKSHSKTDLIDLINDLNLPVVHSHQDNKKDIQDKFIHCLNEKLTIPENFYKIKTKEDLINYIKNKNPKKTLSIKEKQDVMKICKKIIQYCKSNYDLENTDYNNYQELIDDMDYIKQFGDIPSVRRCCRLMNDDVKTSGIKFIPLISPQVKKELEEKNNVKAVKTYKLTIKRATPEQPIVLYFD